MSTKLTGTVHVLMEGRFRRRSGAAAGPVHRGRVVAVAFPRLWCWRSECAAAVTSRSAGTASVAGALILGHATPDAVTLGGGEGVGAAVGEHGAVLADLFGGALTLGPGRAAFTVRGEEDLGVGTAAGGAALPSKVDEVVRMIRHCGISRFRSRTVKRFAGKSGHALVRMAGLGQSPTVRAQKSIRVWVGVASLGRRELDRVRATALAKAFATRRRKRIRISLLMLKRSSSASDCCSRCGTSSATEVGVCCADAWSRHRVGWEASGCPGSPHTVLRLASK